MMVDAPPVRDVRPMQSLRMDIAAYAPALEQTRRLEADMAHLAREYRGRGIAISDANGEFADLAPAQRARYYAKSVMCALGGEILLDNNDRQLLALARSRGRTRSVPITSSPTLRTPTL